VRAFHDEEFVEYRMIEAQDAPIAIAASTDGSIWFTIDHADVIGHLRNGRIERLPTSGRNIEPIGLAVAANGSAWYTDPPHAPLRASAASARSHGLCSTPRSLASDASR
jgi:virginiamycin B lyase